MGTGRRGVDVSQSQRWVFNRLAQAYRSRPGYPTELVQRLAELAGAQGRVADLGAGTGLLSVPLSEHGLEVSAVEPAREMLAVLEEANAPRVRPVHAAAEATGLETEAYSLVLYADALHWVDPELAGNEARRILQPGGTGAIIEPRLAETPFLQELGKLLSRHNPKSRRVTNESARQLLLLATGNRELQREEFLHEVLLPGNTFEEVLRSLSFIGPALGEQELSELLREARALAEAHGGAYWRRTLTLHWARSAR